MKSLSYYFKINTILTCLILALSSNAYSKDSTKIQNPVVIKSTIAENINVNPVPKITRDNRFGFLTTFEFALSFSVLIFGFFVLMMEIRYLKNNPAITADTFIKVVLITLVIISTLFLITAGFENNEIAPAFGILGTIAGYLLGKSTT